MNLLITVISAYYLNTLFSVKPHTPMSFFYIGNNLLSILEFLSIF